MRLVFCKKNKVILFFAIFMFLLSGCKQEKGLLDMSMDTETSEDVELNASVADMEEEIVQELKEDNTEDAIEQMAEEPTDEIDVETIKTAALDAYQEYIAGEKMLEFATPTGESDKRYYTQYAIWDVNGDMIPELHIDNGRDYDVLSYAYDTNQISYWAHFGYPTDYYIREDGSYIYWGEPRSITNYMVPFRSFTLGKDGEEEKVVSFWMRDANDDGLYDSLDEYGLNGEMYNYEDWYKVAEAYLCIKENEPISLKELELRDLVEWTVYCEENL